MIMDIQTKELMRNKEFQWKIANKLATERLNAINKISNRVVPRDTIYTRYIKRFIDIFVSLIALIIFFPINLLIGMVTLFDVGTPLFFIQKRTGLNGKEFKIIKFRNMKNTYDNNGNLLPASQRVTKWGRFVRKLSLDELLNFWSVLKGDMSIIGPRPLPVQYYDRYSDRHKARHTVRPGLECPARDKVIYIRNWQEQFENDVWYVQNVCFKVDLMLSIRLVQFAFDRKNSDARANAIRGSFVGYSQDGIALSSEELSNEFILEFAKEFFDEE